MKGVEIMKINKIKIDKPYIQRLLLAQDLYLSKKEFRELLKQLKTTLKTVVVQSLDELEIYMLIIIGNMRGEKL